jgi:hypothetical protein
MNLRKLLCGLLALCLLLTMAPAALMEEAPVEEVVVELGGEEVAAVEEAPEEIAGEALEADEYNMVHFADAGATLTLPSDDGEYNSTTYMSAVDGALSIEAAAGWKIVDYVAPRNMRAIEVSSDADATTTAADGEETTITSIDVKCVTTTSGKYITGKGNLSVYIAKEGSTRKVKCDVNIIVYDPTKPVAMDLYTYGLLINGKTLDADVSDGFMPVYALVYPELIGKEVVWTSSNTKVAKVDSKLTLTEELPASDTGDEKHDAALEELEEATGEGDTLAPAYAYNEVYFVGKGTATITAKCGSVSQKFKVKVTDKYAPKSIKIYAQAEGDEGTTATTTKIPVGEGAFVYSVVSPTRDTLDGLVTYSIDSNKKACFATAVTVNDDGEYVYTITDKKTIDADADGRCVLFGLTEGKVKLTAKTYNGKKATLTLTIFDPDKPDSIEIYGFYNKELFEHELYDEDETEDPTKPVKSAFLLMPILKNADGDPVSPVTHRVDYASVKWTSSNKKVATIGILKNFTGYTQDNLVTGSADDDDGDAAALVDEFFDTDDVDAYGALVKVVGTGTTKLTAKTKDGKKSFTITLKVVNNHKCTDIDVPSETVELPIGYPVDLDEYFVIYPDDFYGTVTAKPTHSTSKVTQLGDTRIRGNKAGTVTIKVKTSDGKSKSFKVKFA